MRRATCHHGNSMRTNQCFCLFRGWRILSPLKQTPPLLHPRRANNNLAHLGKPGKERPRKIWNAKEANREKKKSHKDSNTARELFLLNHVCLHPCMSKLVAHSSNRLRLQAAKKINFAATIHYNSLHSGEMHVTWMMEREKEITDVKSHHWNGTENNTFR